MFVGTYTRKLQSGGWVNFPNDWLALLGEGREVFIMPDPANPKMLLVVTADEYRKAKDVRLATLVKISDDGRLRIPADLLSQAKIGETACFAGRIRMISVTAK